MHRTGAKDISKFFIAGINYRKTDALIRGQFAVNPEQYNTILQLAPDFAVHEFFLISTCNRTEVYGFADNADQLIRFKIAKRFAHGAIALLEPANLCL